MFWKRSALLKHKNIFLKFINNFFLLPWSKFCFSFGVTQCFLVSAKLFSLIWLLDWVCEFSDREQLLLAICDANLFLVVFSTCVIHKSKIPPTMWFNMKSINLTISSWMMMKWINDQNETTNRPEGNTNEYMYIQWCERWTKGPSGQRFYAVKSELQVTTAFLSRLENFCLQFIIYLQLF